MSLSNENWDSVTTLRISGLKCVGSQDQISFPLTFLCPFLSDMLTKLKCCPVRGFVSPAVPKLTAGGDGGGRAVPPGTPERHLAHWVRDRLSCVGGQSVSACRRPT